MSNRQVSEIRDCSAGIQRFNDTRKWFLEFCASRPYKNMSVRWSVFSLKKFRPRDQIRCSEEIVNSLGELITNIHKWRHLITTNRRIRVKYPIWSSSTQFKNTGKFWFQESKMITKRRLSIINSLLVMVFLPRLGSMKLC